jgi:hypothetical protein
VLERFEASLNVANDVGTHIRTRDSMSRSVGFFLCAFKDRLMATSLTHLILG